MEIDNAYSVDYLGSVEIIQGSFYFCILICLFTLYIINISNNITTINIPFINIDLQLKTVLGFTTILYFLNSLIMSYFTRRAIRVFQKINNKENMFSVCQYPLSTSRNNLFGVVLLASFIFINILVYSEGFNFAWYINITVGTLTCWGYWDAFYEARKHLPKT